MPESPLRRSADVVSVNLFSDGKPVPDSLQLLSIQVDRVVNEVPSARLLIQDGNAAQQEWPVSDGQWFKPGSLIRIDAGYNGNTEQVFVGFVVEHGIRIGSDGESRLVVDCLDAATRLCENRRSARFENCSNQEIFAELATRHGLSVAMPAASERLPTLVQYDCSDWEFLLARAAANDLLVIPDAGKLVLQAAGSTSLPTSLCVTYGDDLISFEATIDANTTQAVGKLSFQGNAKARVGELIELDGLGQRFSGPALISAVRHRIEDGEWLTEVNIGQAPRQSSLTTPGRRSAAPGGLPLVSGLQTGIVQRLDGDPTGELRILLSLPTMGAAGDAIWARLLQFQASAGFGAFFIPEVGDEVVVGFLADDPSRPVVVGSLYGSKNKPAYELTAENDIKALTTRAKLRIEFDDKRKVITMNTPAGNQVLIDDENKCLELSDQHGNQVRLMQQGLIFSSTKDIALSASGKISLDAAGSIEISSKADVKTRGLNVICEADVGFIGKADATAELSASGQTTVKGAMVLIN